MCYILIISVFEYLAYLWEGVRIPVHQSKRMESWCVLLKADPEICPFAGTANNEVFSYSQDFYIQNILCLKDVWCICSVSNCI